MILKHSQ